MSLKLKPLPDRTTRKLTLQVPPELYADLEAYGIAYSTEYGREERVNDLAVAMLEAFLSSDSQFRRSRRTQTQPNSNQPEKE